MNRTAAVAQIEWIQNFVQFQTTLAYLKYPTPECQLPPIDIVGGLDKIGQDAETRSYENEFDFELDIFNLIAHADDGHFIYEPFLVQGFGFNRTISLVSVSMDSGQLPKVYTQCKIIRSSPLHLLQCLISALLLFREVTLTNVFSRR